MLCDGADEMMVLNILVCDVIIDFRMLVGAPTAQTTQPGVLRGGAVYKCDTNLPGSRCAPVPFDNTGNAHFHLFHSTVSNAHQAYNL